MTISRKVLVLAFVVLILGLILFCLGLVFDPFSLPFQDYEQMPLEMRQAYEARSAWMGILRFFGCGLFSLAPLIVLFAWFIGRRKLQE